ncbi:MAG: MBL fold metallo-hydrolase [Desulfobacterales bacterium]|nr:MBL fold metallo-hydrolase [Desulfobacterales bacterium]
MGLVAKDEDIQIENLSLGPYGTNSYILICARTGDSVVVDAPAEASVIQERLKETNPRYLLITHNHFDHTGALKALKAELAIPVAAHPEDATQLPLKPDILLKGGEALSFGKVELKVFHTPGHTPGSLCFYAEDYLIAGDTIFPGGPGKTSSPENLKQIIESITSKIFTLPDDTRIFPGHGDSTVLKLEKEAFAVFSSHQHDPELCGDVLWLSS